MSKTLPSSTLTAVGAALAVDAVLAVAVAASDRSCGGPGGDGGGLVVLLLFAWIMGLPALVIWAAGRDERRGATTWLVAIRDLGVAAVVAAHLAVILEAFALAPLCGFLG